LNINDFVFVAGSTNDLFSKQQTGGLGQNPGAGRLTMISVDI
jgi:hypothetical protein